jgi:hypothetical protein
VLTINGPVLPNFAFEDNQFLLSSEIQES